MPDITTDFGFSQETITARRDGAVAIIELNRPASLNAVNVALARELLGALEAIGNDRSIGAVVLTGAGRGFCSGFDLKDGGVPALPSGMPDTGWGLREVFNPLVLALRELPQPVIAAVNGVAAGIGCSYALACDLVVAARSASLLLAFVNVALVPDGGSAVLVSARAGWGRALEMSLLGDRVSAEQALEWGLVNGVEDDESLMDAVLTLAHRVAAGPPEGHAAIKQVLNAPFLEPLKRQLALEAETQAVRSSSAEAVEAVTAFLQKRAPQYRPG